MCDAMYTLQTSASIPFVPCRATAPVAIPHLAKLMALAIKYDRMIQDGLVRDDEGTLASELPFSKCYQAFGVPLANRKSAIGNRK